MPRRAAIKGATWKDRMSNAPRPSKNERRDAAREKAREERLRQQKREKRSRLVLQLSIGVVILAIVAIVSVVIVNSVRPAGPGPANMASGGVALEGADLAAVRTDAPAADAVPAPQATGPDGKVLIQVFEDFGCPICQAFEQANGTQIEELVSSGAAVVEYHPVAILDNRFTDRNYSTRAANAAAAVAAYSPDTFSAFHSLLYDTDVQPEEGGSGLTDDRLVELVEQSGATNLGRIETAIRDRTFASWVRQRTDEFTESTGALADVEFPADRQGAGTPTVVVNGQYFTGDPRTADEFGSFVTQVGGAIGATPSATPAPSASASE